MIGGHFYQGSGLGNQLHRYVFTRVKANDLGVPFGMENPELFKGSSFMNLDMGQPLVGEFSAFIEKRVNNENGVDIRPYDKRTEKIKDWTVVDGEFQAERYWEHRKDEVREWLSVERVEMPDDLCVIGFRGGEYALYPDLFLPYEYWQKGAEIMKEQNPNMKFHVVTDDPVLAAKFFPFPISHEIGMDWRMIRYAKYLLLSNSSFYILPSHLNQDVKLIVAPKFWARHNLGFWSLKQNKYKGWRYI